MRVYHFISEQFALQAIENQRLKVATINELNDPFELFACDLTDSKYRRPFLKWKNNIAERVGFLCFSKDWSNPLLWSHYADRHRGVTLEVEIDEQLTIPVNYSASRLILNIEQIKKDGGFSDQLAERLATTKSKHWRYEKEVRIPVNLSTCIVDKGLYFERLTEQVKITGLVFGPLSKLTTADLQRVLPYGQQLRLRWGRLGFGSYNVVNNRQKSLQIVNSTAP
jgi:Protein of unknown function (DUF2971)